MDRTALVVDDDADFRRGIGLILRGKGLRHESAATAEEALDALTHRHFDLVFTDLKMPGMGGLALLREIRRQWPKTIVVMITGFGTIETAVQAMSEGAFHYVTKPFNNSEIAMTVERALREKEMADELDHLRAEVERRYGFANLIGRDRQMVQIFELIRKVAGTSVPVLITGESGTGKELVARAIHYEGARSKGPFVGLNASALPDTLAEAELFGARKGAFTGADRDRQGLLLKASGGTLFLDEIGSMSPSLQSKFLRVLQEKEMTPLGTSEPVKVDLRVVSATHVDLDAEVRAHRFREDLYYRLNVVQIRLPSLRARMADLPLLVEHFQKKYAEAQGCERKLFTPSAMRLLTAYVWPGNVRELENVVSRAMVIAEGPEILPRDIVLMDERFSWVGQGNGFYGLPYDQAKERAIDVFQKEYVARLLDECEGNITRAAERSGITRAALRRIIQKHRITSEAKKGQPE